MVVTPNTVLPLEVRFVFSFVLYPLLPFVVNVSICNSTAIVPAMISLKLMTSILLTPTPGDIAGFCWGCS